MYPSLKEQAEIVQTWQERLVILENAVEDLQRRLAWVEEDLRDEWSCDRETSEQEDYTDFEDEPEEFETSN